MRKLMEKPCGSSPRMWGTPPGKIKGPVEGRFIPTHVGNTLTFRMANSLCSVHPHACGEHPSNPASGRNWIGSSPRMWGTHFRNISVISATRFIPTHVGNTVFSASTVGIMSVHPHACGEHSAPASSRTSSTGSSPRMWGTRLCAAGKGARCRFIPTHVGNTQQRDWTLDCRAVHPHACGEHWFVWRTPPRSDGSSPRMWGTPGSLPVPVALDRFIPTHVGNTSAPRRSARRRSVHPHACGEHPDCRYRPDRERGSSPRMWGTHLPYSIVFKEEKTPRKIYRLILYSVVRSRGWNATNCSPSNNTGCRRLTPRVWNS